MRINAENGIVKILQKEGIAWVSTFPEGIINNACGEEGIQNIMTRTERYAVALADGFSRVSNGKKFGVCSIMSGLNAAGIQMAYGALAQAWEDSTPLLCITTGIPSEIKGQEHYDLFQAFRNISKWIGYINTPNRVPEYMTKAISYLKSGKLGPVLIQLPPNLGQYDDDEHIYYPIKRRKFQGDPSDVKVASRALLSAKNPIIYAGQGIFYADACDELLRFASLLNAPVLTTLKGKSAFPEDHPLSLGVRGIPVEKFLKKSDLILAIGWSQVPNPFGNTIPSGKPIIQVTIDDMDINWKYNVNHAIIGDAKLVLNQLIKEVEDQGVANRRAQKKLIEEIQVAKEEQISKYKSYLTSNEKPINPYRVFYELSNLINKNNSIVTPESGGTRDQLSTIYEATIPHGFIGWGNVSTLGFSLGAAAGAKLAFPNRQVINVTGDAGVGYMHGDFETLLRNNIGVTTIHINNNGFSGYGPGFWGAGHHPYTADVTSSSIQNMARSVEAIGLYAERVEEPDEVAPAIKRALKQNLSGKPSYIEIICSQFPIWDNWV